MSTSRKGIHKKQTVKNDKENSKDLESEVNSSDENGSTTQSSDELDSSHVSASDSDEFEPFITGNALFSDLEDDKELVHMTDADYEIIRELSEKVDRLEVNLDLLIEDNEEFINDMYPFDPDAVLEFTIAEEKRKQESLEAMIERFENKKNKLKNGEENEVGEDRDNHMKSSMDELDNYEIHISSGEENLQSLGKAATKKGIVGANKLCKLCNKYRFKKFAFCYSHSQNNNLIPKHIRRTDYNDYIKSLES